MKRNRKWYNFLNTSTINVKIENESNEINRIIIVHDSHHIDVNGNTISFCQKMQEIRDDHPILL